MEKIDSSNFESVITNGTILVDFYADWCGPCNMLLPVLEELEKRNPITIKKVNVDNSIDLAKRYGVMTIPTLILFQDGKELKKVTGLLSLDELENFLNK